jgi:epoxyqueuosine reductase
MNFTKRIESRAVELGFDLVGIAPAGVAPHAGEYTAWLASGMMGEMAYLARDPDRRSDLRRVLPNAQSVIVVGLNYYTIDLPGEVKSDPSRGLIARYAWGVDYHEVMRPRLEELAQFVREESRRTGMGMPVATKVYVDTGPVLERDWALAAGLGFIGKNTCLINPRRGSWLFLGVIITDVDLETTSLRGAQPATTSLRGALSATKQSLLIGTEIASPKALAMTNAASCGTCTRCLTACPTNAFPAPYILDARKCISYLTIELKGSIPIELRPLLGNRIFGCDICQDVCPWPTRFAAPTEERSFYPINVDRAAPRLIDLAQLSEEAFKQRFAGTPIVRSKRRGLLRNVAVALGNWGSTEAREALEMLARDADPIIAEHARWGLRRY